MVKAVQEINGCLFYESYVTHIHCVGNTQRALMQK